MLTASDVSTLLLTMGLIMGAWLGFMMAIEYRAQQRQHAEQHGVMLSRFDALGVVVVRELRHAPASPASVRREINEADAALRANDEKPPAVPPDERPRAPTCAASWLRSGSTATTRTPWRRTCSAHPASARWAPSSTGRTTAPPDAPAVASPPVVAVASASGAAADVDPRQLDLLAWKPRRPPRPVASRPGQLSLLFGIDIEPEPPKK